MARIIDVENCIKNLPVNTEGSIKIRVDDDQCPWNNKTFEVYTLNNALDVKNSEDNEKNARISIKGLTALVYGTIPVGKIEYLDWLEVKTEKEKKLLQDWFPVKPYWMIEDF